MSAEKIYEIVRHTDTEIAGFFNEYRWLSNFHICPVEYMGIPFISTENAYQAAKHHPSDWHLYQSATPKDAMMLGRENPPFRGLENWHKDRVDVMRKVNKDKFNRNRLLGDKLIATNPKHLEETNWWGDVFWGKCNGAGENQLGKILMEVRQWLLDLRAHSNF